MDYLDSRKQLEHRVILLVGYVFVAAAIVIATLILLYQAYGFGLGKNGTVIQNGLVFVSSQPNPADIYLNGKLNSSTTNARLLLPGGVYRLRLKRPGYNDWFRVIGVDGGAVTHFDYPVLFPTKLTSSIVHAYSASPGLATQSPDRRWLLVQQPGSSGVFDMYDLKDPNKVVPTAITVPSGILGKASSKENWQLVSWADDNQHVLLQHTFDGKAEYVLIDRTDPSQSVNLTTTLKLPSTTQLTLSNKKYNQYYLYDTNTDALDTASLSNTAPVPLLGHVLAYQSYGNNTVLYATDSNAPAGKVLVKLAIGNRAYLIHTFPTATNYLLDLTQYAGTLYVAAGASNQNKVYIYKDPIAQLHGDPTQAVVPSQVLHVVDPNYLSFSDNTQFIVAEHGSQFGVYDIENKNGYNYNTKLPVDSPQLHASWMDGDRLTYVSGGKLVVFDYDHANPQTLVGLNAAYLPFFSSDYHYLYGLGPDSSSGQPDLTQTPLLASADL